MKRTMILFCMLVAAFFAGCKSIPTVQQTYIMSCAVGVSVAKVANIYDKDIPVEMRNTIIDVVEKVTYSTPDTNETFSTAWTPIARQHLDSLAWLTEIQKEKIMITVNMATSALDRYVNKHENIKNNKEYLSAVVKGFSIGFLSNFKPANTFSTANIAEYEYDKDTYEFLISEFCK